MLYYTPISLPKEPQMRRPPFLEQSGLVPPARGRRAANAARRREMRWNRDVGLTMRQEIRLSRHRDDGSFAAFAPEDQAEMVRWLQPFEAAEKVDGAREAEEGGAMPDR